MMMMMMEGTQWCAKTGRKSAARVARSFVLAAGFLVQGDPSGWLLAFVETNVLSLVLKRTFKSDVYKS